MYPGSKIASKGPMFFSFLNLLKPLFVQIIFKFIYIRDL